MKTAATIFVAVLSQASGFLHGHSALLATSLAETTRPRTSLKSDFSAESPSPILNVGAGNGLKNRKTVGKNNGFINKKSAGFTVAAALLGSSWLLKGPFALTAIPYVACLVWGLPSSMVGSWKSIVSMAHRFGGMGTLVVPLLMASYHALTGFFPTKLLYFATVAVAATNLGFGAALICRRVPGYDIPTLRAFAVGVSLGYAFLGHSLLFVLGGLPWYRPIGVLFCAISVYSTIFATSDALQHAWNYCSGKRGTSPNGLDVSDGHGPRRFWNLPFEKAKWTDVFLFNLWRQPTPEALQATVSPANSVVVFTTDMTAFFASLSLLQLRYLFLGPAGMNRLFVAEPAFCNWSALQALLAVVANNFGTFAGTLVIQRRKSQKQAGTYNAIGLLIPVLNLVAFLLLHPGLTAANFGRLMMLPSV